MITSTDLAAVQPYEQGHEIIGMAMKTLDCAGSWGSQIETG
jgi:hypothetical protein